MSVVEPIISFTRELHPTPTLEKGVFVLGGDGVERMSKHNRLPDGTFTEDYDPYITKWEQLIQPMLEKLNLKLIGFDPGYLVQMTEKPHTTLEIPCWFVRRFNSACRSCNLHKSGRTPEEASMKLIEGGTC